jgi:hypothetical protein
MIRWALLAPRDRFLALLAAGWELPWIVQPMAGPHGHYSVLLTRADAPDVAIQVTKSYSYNVTIGNGGPGWPGNASATNR